MNIQLNPFPLNKDWIAWVWLQQYPAANFDDYGPKTIADFRRDLQRRLIEGHSLTGVSLDHRIVGLIGFRKDTSRLGHFSGICFSKDVHGKGIAFESVKQFLGKRWAEGIEKIEAMFFADNSRIERLFERLGGQHEGLLRKHTMRNGQFIDCKLMGFIRPEVI